MNYDHAYHAGNPADVVKHAALTLVLLELLRKETPIHYVDTHAGAGLFEIFDPTGEWTQGIGRLSSGSLRRRLPELRAYFDLVDSVDRDVYPGSPRFAQAMLREQDRLDLFELQPDDKARLDQTMRGDGRVRTHLADGYEGWGRVKGSREDRLLMLVDPPFESPTEWNRIEETIVRISVKRPGATILLWYPVKSGEPHEGRPEKLKVGLEAARVRGASVELTARGGMLLPRTNIPKVRGALRGSGLLFVGAPHRALARLAAALPELARGMARTEHGSGWGVSWEGWG